MNNTIEAQCVAYSFTAAMDIIVCMQVLSAMVINVMMGGGGGNLVVVV